MVSVKEDVSPKAALPYWAHKRGVVSAGGVYLPSKTDPLPDAITGATPTGSFALYTRLDNTRDEIVVLMEINRSYDYNNTYPEDSAEKEYTDRNFSGQPALIYAATLNLRESPSYQGMRLLGHSDPEGASGKLFQDVSTVDTALQLVDRVTVELPEGE